MLESTFATRATHIRPSEIRELFKRVGEPGTISFAGGLPYPALFPAKEFGDAFASILDSEKCGMALQYGNSEGYAPLREWIANEMGRIGVPCGIQNIVITSGSQQALDYCGKLFLSPNDTGLLEWPTYLGALGAFRAYEAHFDKLDVSGNRSAEAYRGTAARLGGRVKFAYAPVDFANPTGITLPLPERHRLLDLADELDLAIIEDAAYQALRFEGEPIPPILALDIERQGSIENARTLYLGTFSKTLSPGLRVGWICGPASVISKIVLMKQASDLHSGVINQMVTADVVTRCFDTHVGKI